jgi:hypothetical protein
MEMIRVKHIDTTTSASFPGQRAEQREYLFENGNAVSVIRSPMSYGYDHGLFEAIYITDTTTLGDPDGWLDIMGLVKFLRRARNFTLAQQEVLDEEELAWAEYPYETDRSALDELHLESPDAQRT